MFCGYEIHVTIKRTSGRPIFTINGENFAFRETRYPLLFSGWFPQIKGIFAAGSDFLELLECAYLSLYMHRLNQLPDGPQESSDQEVSPPQIEM